MSEVAGTTAQRGGNTAAAPSLISEHQRWLFTERKFHLSASLETELDEARFLHWWLYRLRVEYRAGPEAVDWEHLAAPAPGLHGPFSNHITVAMRMWWLLRNDLQTAFDLATPQGRAGYAAWFYRFGLFQMELDASPYLDAVLPSLAAPCSTDESPHPINRFAAAALSCFSKQLLDLLNSADLESVEQLFGAPLQQVAPELLFVYRQLPHGVLAVPPVSARATRTEPPRAHGANLIGYAHGAFGMAEHVRMTARALSCRTDDFSIVNVETYVHVRQPEPDVVEWAARKERYRTNIFHVNADAMASAVTVLGPRSFEGAYNIGYWAWELSNIPTDWRASIDFVDEIWAPSRFIQEAFQSSTSKPVIYMPLCVDLSFDDWKRRRHFGLPETSYLFLYYFDSYSYYQRKNPYAALRAFKAAFPDRRDVGLVIKCQNAKEDSPEWRELRDLVADDPRVFVINRVMTKSEIMSLQAECDCFVSLHRSEGFGRGPAEAMWLGKPVIATGYSGNVDFTRPDNSLLVDYRLVDVRKDEYPFWQGQVWAEPDEAHAVAHMRRLVEEPQLGVQLGVRGSALMRSEFSYAAIGARYEARLKEIGALR